MADLLTRESACCFTGHRPNKLPWHYDETDPRCAAAKSWLDKAVEDAYEDGYRHFICGMAMGGDFYFCESVIKLRDQHPEVILEAAIPCPQQSQHWPTEQILRYVKLCGQCNLVNVLQSSYDRACMLRRDRYMVARSGRIISLFNGTPGGTMQTLAYALQEKLEIVRLDPEEIQVC
jgi:uncharacterized phage-like protein YoqJ